MVGQQPEARARMQNHCAAIKVLRSDCGNEFPGDAFDEHLAAAGAIRRRTV
jgi:hypothetical protein